MESIRRFGKVIGIKESQIIHYIKLHADKHPGVRFFISQACISNFSIYIQKFEDGKHYLFSYFEYTGDDYDSDMAKMAEQSEIKSWLSVTDPMQIPFPGDSSWKEMEQVFFNK